MREYPREWLEAVDRGLADTRARRLTSHGEITKREDLELILDHLVPLIRSNFEAGLKPASNEGSVPGADMGGIPYQASGRSGLELVDVEHAINQLLDQLCQEALYRFDRANTEGDPRREPLAQIANVLNTVREARGGDAT